MRISPLLVLALTLCAATHASAASDTSQYTSSANIEPEQLVLSAAISILDHYMLAGTESDAERGAMLLAAFEVNSRRAIYDTKQLYRKQQNILSSYRSISSDLYGYEINKNMFGTSIQLEGGIETESGVFNEFNATLTYRRNRWVISKLAID